MDILKKLLYPSVLSLADRREMVFAATICRIRQKMRVIIRFIESLFPMDGLL